MWLGKAKTYLLRDLHYNEHSDTIQVPEFSNNSGILDIFNNSLGSFFLREAGWGRFLTDLVNQLGLDLRRERSSHRPDPDPNGARACCFDQKEESFLIGRDLFSFLLFHRVEKQEMLVESLRERSRHKRPLPTSTRSIGSCVMWDCIRSIPEAQFYNLRDSTKSPVLGRYVLPLFQFLTSPLRSYTHISLPMPALYCTKTKKKSKMLRFIHPTQSTKRSRRFCMFDSSLNLV
jgi:hypothetical protein